MTDTYQNWIKRVVDGSDAKPLDAGEIVKSSAGQPFGTIEFVKIQKRAFLAEVGKKGDKYIYHFFPVPPLQPDVSTTMISEKIIAGFTTFSSAMTRAFIEIFKREDQIEAEWVDEMKAWAVRVSGWTDNVWGDELALRAIDLLDELLKKDKD